MKLFKKTYHFFSALTLVLFLSSIVLPTSMSAAMLFCEMDMEVMGQAHDTDIDTCCDYHKSLSTNEAAAIAASDNPCTYQKVCAEAVAKDDRTKKATLQVSKGFVAALVFTNIFIDDTEPPKLQIAKSETVKPQKNQPIFLLNSTFLN